MRSVSQKLHTNIYFKINRELDYNMVCLITNSLWGHIEIHLIVPPRQSIRDSVRNNFNPKNIVL